MSAIAKAGEHTDAVVVALAAADLQVFDAGPPPQRAPDGVEKTWGWVPGEVPGQSDFRAYVILYPLPGGFFDGPIGCPDDDAEMIWQVTCVAETRQRCQHISDQATAALVGQTLAVAGRSVCRLQLDMDGGVRRDDTVQPPVFISTPRFSRHFDARIGAAMALLATQQVQITGPAITHAAAAAGGDTVAPDERTCLWVKNAHATLSRTVTVVVPGQTWGQNNPDVAVTVPALSERLIGPIQRALADTDGYVDVTYSDSAANLTVAAVRV